MSIGLYYILTPLCCLFACQRGVSRCCVWRSNAAMGYEPHTVDERQTCLLLRPVLPAPTHTQSIPPPVFFFLYLSLSSPPFFSLGAPRPKATWLEAHVAFRPSLYFVLCKRSGEGNGKRKEEKTGWRMEGAKQADGCCGSVRGTLPAERAVIPWAICYEPSVSFLHDFFGRHCIVFSSHMIYNFRGGACPG